MIGVAILGTGAIAAAHVRAYRRFAQRCRIVSLCDLYPDKARALDREHGLAAAIHTEMEAAVAQPGVDLVSICLPPSLHRQAAVLALEAGRHVLLEKPMAPSLADCDAILAAASGSGRVLSVVAQNRFRTPMMRVKSLLDQGAVGRVLHAQVDSWWWRGASYYDLWWRGTWQSEGGGCTLNHAVHHVDLLAWMRGLPVEVTAAMANTNHDNSEVEDLSIAILRHQDGTLSQITSSLVHHGEEQQLMFQGERAGLWIPFRVKAGRSKENGFPVEDPETERSLREAYDGLPALTHEGHDGQIDDVLSAIEEARGPLVDGVQGRRTVELITAIYESAASRRPAPLPLDPSDPLYTASGLVERMPRFHEKRRSVAGFAPSDITLGRDMTR